jgi:hypothetical protein
MFIHNKKNEEWIQKKQSIATHTIELREDQFDLETTSEQERLFKNYPILVQVKVCALQGSKVAHVQCWPFFPKISGA